MSLAGGRFALLRPPHGQPIKPGTNAPERHGHDGYLDADAGLALPNGGVYSGDSKFAGSTSAALNQVVSGSGPCDINPDGVVDVRDVNLTILQALGAAPLTIQPMINAVTVQIVINAVLGLGCAL